MLDLEARMLWAFAAGVAAFFSPCGLPMLPAYLSYYLGLDHGEQALRASRLRRGSGAARGVGPGLLGGIVAGLGILAFFGALGLLVGTTGSLIPENFTLAIPIVALLVLALAVLTLMGVDIVLPLHLRAVSGQGLTRLFLFGILYALAGLSCTAPIFFLVVATAFLETGAGIGLLVFLAYAAGIVLLMLVATVLVTTVGEGALVRFKRALPYVRPASALVMLAVGGYLLAYYFTR